MTLEGENPIQRWDCPQIEMRMKKKKKAGKKATKWQSNWMRSNIWKILLREEEWKEAP